MWEMYLRGGRGCFFASRPILPDSWNMLMTTAGTPATILGQEVVLGMTTKWSLEACRYDPVFPSARLEQFFPPSVISGSSSSEPKQMLLGCLLSPGWQGHSAVLVLEAGLWWGCWGCYPSMNWCWCQRWLIVTQGPLQVNFSTWDRQRYKEMAQLVKDLPCKHHDWTWIPEPMWKVRHGGICL